MTTELLEELSIVFSRKVGEWIRSLERQYFFHPEIIIFVNFLLSQSACPRHYSLLPFSDLGSSYLKSLAKRKRTERNVQKVARKAHELFQELDFRMASELQKDIVEDWTLVQYILDL